MALTHHIGPIGFLIAVATAAIATVINHWGRRRKVQTDVAHLSALAERSGGRDFPPALTTDQAIIFQSERWRFVAQFAGVFVGQIVSLAILYEFAFLIRPIDIGGVAALTGVSALWALGCWFLFRYATHPPKLSIDPISIYLDTPRGRMTWKYDDIENFEVIGDRILVWTNRGVHSGRISYVFPEGAGHIARALRAALSSKRSNPAELRQDVVAALSDPTPITFSENWPERR